MELPFMHWNENELVLSEGQYIQYIYNAKVKKPIPKILYTQVKTLTKHDSDMMLVMLL